MYSTTSFFPSFSSCLHLAAGEAAPIDVLSKIEPEAERPLYMDLQATTPTVRPSSTVSKAMIVKKGGKNSQCSLSICLVIQEYHCVVL